MTDFAADITARSSRAQARNNGHPEPAWSTGERLIVALVLGNQATLDSEGYTKAAGTPAAIRGTSRSTAAPPTPRPGLPASGPRSDPARS